MAIVVCVGGNLAQMDNMRLWSCLAKAWNSLYIIAFLYTQNETVSCKKKESWYTDTMIRPSTLNQVKEPYNSSETFTYNNIIDLSKGIRVSSTYLQAWHNALATTLLQYVAY